MTAMEFIVRQLGSTPIRDIHGTINRLLDERGYVSSTMLAVECQLRKNTAAQRVSRAAKRMGLELLRIEHGRTGRKIKIYGRRGQWSGPIQPPKEISK